MTSPGGVWGWAGALWAGLSHIPPTALGFGQVEEVWLPAQEVQNLWLSDPGVLGLQALEGHLEPSPCSPDP